MFMYLFCRMLKFGYFCCSLRFPYFIDNKMITLYFLQLTGKDWQRRLEVSNTKYVKTTVELLFARHVQYVCKTCSVYDNLNVMSILSFYHFNLPLTGLHHVNRNIGRCTQKLLFLTHQVP